MAKLQHFMAKLQYIHATVRPCLRQLKCMRQAVSPKQLYVPRVKIKSSQQLSLLTFIIHVSPVLSCAVAEVPVVMILSGRELGDDSVGGGCSILTIGALAL
jgi:hypothetical protein